MHITGIHPPYVPLILVYIDLTFDPPQFLLARLNLPVVPGQIRSGYMPARE